jgi:hypothetical protein
MTVVEPAAAANTAELPAADLVTNIEFRLAYSPLQGRMWRTDATGRILHELPLWHYSEAQDEVKIVGITVATCCKRKATHVIHYMMTSKWPQPGLVVDHINRDGRDNRWENLRETTQSRNLMNVDYGYRRTRALDEVLEQGTRKLANGRYVVSVCSVYIGTFDSLVAANEACRKARRQLKGEFDVPFVTTRRIIRGTAP